MNAFKSFWSFQMHFMHAIIKRNIPPFIHSNKKRRLEKQRRKYIFLQKPAVETEVCQRGKGNDTDRGNTEHFHKETIHFSCRNACF